MRIFPSFQTKLSVRAIYIGTDDGLVQQLQSCLSKSHPNVQIIASFVHLQAAHAMLEGQGPCLIFWDLCPAETHDFSRLHWMSKQGFETILLAPQRSSFVEAIRCAALGYLAKPIEVDMLDLLVCNALHRIQLMEELRRSKKMINSLVYQNAQNDLISIPTTEGYEFTRVHNILRCEGLQKYTRVITRDRGDLVSSYNLGQFRKLLEPYHFFSPHKSFLINLQYLERYHKEGNIYMVDGGCVPVAKRMKKAFLLQIRQF
ncbi:MAG: LytTR family transcriptional regulator DNA-binding domain-containing protein [Bacteroidota bacterium]